jgi:hypothetical protein
MSTTNDLFLAELKAFIAKVKSGAVSLPGSDEAPEAPSAFPSFYKTIHITIQNEKESYVELLDDMRLRRRYRKDDLAGDSHVKAHHVYNYNVNDSSVPESSRVIMALGLTLGGRLLEMSRLPAEKIELLASTDDHSLRINFDELQQYDLDELKSSHGGLYDRIIRRRNPHQCINSEEKEILEGEAEWVKMPAADRWKETWLNEEICKLDEEVFTYFCGHYNIGSGALRKLIEQQVMALLLSAGKIFRSNNDEDAVIYFCMHWGIYDVKMIDGYLKKLGLGPFIPPLHSYRKRRDPWEK